MAFFFQCKILYNCDNPLTFLKPTADNACLLQLLKFVIMLTQCTYVFPIIINGVTLSLLVLRPLLAYCTSPG
jgi:hypothetical protein